MTTPWEGVKQMNATAFAQINVLNVNSEACCCFFFIIITCCMILVNRIYRRRNVAERSSEKGEDRLGNR